MVKWKRRLYVLFIFVVAVLGTLRLGEDGEIARHLRGKAQFITEEGLKKFALYDTSARQALIELREYIAQQGLTLPLFQLDAGKAKVCVGIQTARRVNSPYSYLAQALVALVVRMPYLSRRDDVYIHIFNVDSRPQSHPDLDLVKSLAPVTVVRVDVPRSLKPVPLKYKEALQHAEVMKTMASWNCRYPVLVEDDGLAADGWLESLDLAAQQLKLQDEWFLVKLFTARLGKYPARPPGITHYDQGFNTVALLVQPDWLGQLAAEQERAVREAIETQNFNTFEAKDLFLNDFRRKHGLRIQAFEPSIFQHTGVFSSFHARDMRHFAWYMEARNWPSEAKPFVFSESVWHGSQQEIHS